MSTPFVTHSWGEHQLEERIGAVGGAHGDSNFLASERFRRLALDFAVILGVLRENRRNFPSEWAFGYPFLFLVTKHWGHEWLRLFQQARQLEMVWVFRFRSFSIVT